MTAPKAAPSLSEQLVAEANKPLTAKDRVVGVAMALAFLGLATAMILYPTILPVETGDMSGRRARGLVNIIEWLWSRPVGGVLGLLGLIVLYGTLTKKGPSAASSSTPS